jgi:predicted nucleic acid-binding protein
LPEIICDTSPIQYLYQLKLLHILSALARQVAETLGLCLTGTLGLLLDAKRAGLVPKVSPVLDQL